MQPGRSLDPASQGERFKVAEVRTARVQLARLGAVASGENSSTAYRSAIRYLSRFM